MRFSYQWLSEWVRTGLAARQAADRLTAAGLEVDELTAIGEGLDGVVVARIVECRPHPDADRLRVCEVDYGAAAPVTIVCGAPNARAGLLAPLATVGTTLPGGMKIRPAKLRGVASEGMLCSAPELGLGEDSSGLLELASDLEPGAPLARSLGLPDHVIELDLTPNRADCLSIRGIARELAAIESVELSEPVMAPVAARSERTLPIELLDSTDCPRYVGRIVEGVDARAETPPWMVQRLERCGIRSLGPIVDVTNYVLLELGQPMHAFDLDRIKGGIRVRRAESGEALELLNDQRVELDESLLVIADHAGPLALAGIMGGSGSAVEDDTRDLLLESAWFRPEAIIGRARRFGLATDSSHRFERGVDPELQVRAVERATELIVAIAGGKPGPVMDVREESAIPSRPSIELRPERVNRLLGTALDENDTVRILERLGMDVEAGQGVLRVTPPSIRRDLAIEVDLIEEVARMVGYDQLPSRSPRGQLMAFADSERMTPTDALSRALEARGFREIMTWSFVGEAELETLSMADQAQPLANPLSQDLAVLRTSLLPGLLRTARSNLRQQLRRLKLYECGHVFRAADAFVESRRVGLLLAGDARPESWHEGRRAFDFFDLKGEIEQLMAGLGHAGSDMEWSPATRPWLHPGQSAEILLNGDPVGWVGQLHPGLTDRMDLDVPVFVAELALDRIEQRGLPQYLARSRFPSVRRDLALNVPVDVSAARVVDCVKKVAGSLLVECIIFDKYEGKGIESGFKGIAIGLILRDVSRTLTDEDVDSVVEPVVESLQRECHATLRG